MVIEQLLQSINDIEKPGRVRVEEYVSLALFAVLALVGSAVIFQAYWSLKLLEEQIGVDSMRKIYSVLSGSLLPFAALAVGSFVILLVTIIFMHFCRGKMGREDKSRKVADLIIRLISISQDENLSRISSWIHDSISNELVVQKMDVEYLMNKNLVPIKDGERLKNHLTKIIDESRSMMNLIYPRSLSNIGLEATLRSMVKDFERRTHLTVDESFEALDQFQHDELARFLCKIVAESLSNIAKHSNPSRVEITAEFSNGFVTGRVVNDKSKKICSASRQKTGIGLLVLKEHARRLGGSVSTELKETGEFHLCFSFQTKVDLFRNSLSFHACG